jgi:hypothetical protein
MKRRKAIGLLVLTGTGAGLAFSGYKWYDWNKAPDIAYLQNNRELIAALADTIIPADDSPGAKDAGVQDFIIKMVRDCTEIRPANKFIDGLKELEQYCRSKYGKPYEQCAAGEQQQVLRRFEEKGRPLPGILGKVQNKYLGSSFFSTLKEYTVQGYCTSMLGAGKGLAYLPIPGSYHGCIPKLPGQKAWATK